MIWCVAFVSGLMINCEHTGATVLKPPSCPKWSDAAIDELERLIEMRKRNIISIENLERAIGEQHRHCVALDEYLDD